MKKNVIIAACAALFACSCQQQATDTKKDDTNFQERRQECQKPKPKGGCCEAEKVEKLDQAEKTEIVEAVQQAPTVAAPEVKIEKAEKSEKPE